MDKMMRGFFSLSVLVCLGGCGTLPDVPKVEDGMGEARAYPDFVPIGEIALERREAQDRASETEEQLEARVAGLRARAARLRTAQTQ